MNKYLISSLVLTLMYVNKNLTNINSSRNIYYLSNSDFINGTFRITNSGNYILSEDIIFDPCATNNYKPFEHDIKSGKYSDKIGSPYNLGFFAAITIETNNVILDLNGFSIKQSIGHNLNQRFFACIELASSPFIPKQGPISMSQKSNFVAASNCVIKNGFLGKSSHHGIHGNDMNKVVIKDLVITDFEVAGIALNGATDSIIKNVKIKDSSTNVKILSTFSQCSIINKFIKKIKLNNKDAFIKVNNEDIRIDNIITDLNTCIDRAQQGIFDKIFVNESEFPDANIYGLVLNSNGVVINDFSHGRKKESKGNKNILLENIEIYNLITQPVEIIGCQNKLNESKPFTYGKGLFKGPVGDVIDFRKIIDKNFDELILSQLIFLKYNNKNEESTNKLLNYVATGDLTYLDELKKFTVSGSDSMAHIMKGNIGLFISEGLDIKINNCKISNIVSKGDKVGSDSLILPGYINKQGINSYGILMAGSKNVITTNLNINNVISEFGSAKKIERLYTE